MAEIDRAAWDACANPGWASDNPLAAPPEGAPAAGMAAQPGPDTLTVALPISSSVLSQMDSVVVTGAANAISLGV